MIAAQLFEIILVVFALSAGAVIILAAFHDVVMSLRQPRMLKAGRKLTVNRQPAVSIIVLHVTSPEQVDLHIRSLRRTTYKKKAVIFVIDGGIDRMVQQAIRRACRSNHAVAYCPRKPATDDGRVRAARQKLPRDEFYLTLDALTLLEPPALKRAVALLISRPAANAVMLWRRTNDPDSLQGLLRGYMLQSASMIQKALAIVGLPQRQRSDGVLRRTLHNKRQAILGAREQYVCATTAYVETVKSDRLKAATGQSALGILLAGIVSYSSVVAALHVSPTPLFLSWLIVMLWLGASIWFDEGSTTGGKTGSTIGLPVSYFLLPTFMMIEFALGAASRRKTK